MQYEILRTNDNNTATVAMIINGNTLNQDIDMGQSVSDFTANVEQAMAVFNQELIANTVAAPAQTALDKLVGQTQTVTTLPAIPPGDNQPEQPPETPIIPSVA